MLKEGAAVPAAFPDYAAFDGVIAYPNRHTCVLLPIDALLTALGAD